ncbi:MAG: GntR family transcriptional regulator [Acidobacteriota bacterium]|nr:GntR family transcriptional regulator [Blastocatellia bacterium]MDW8240104.1 GntR family transcriptional regulator [Acidobacteriota bacterium]
MSVKFYLEPYSHIPAHVQISDRIKLALLTGQLRPGDTLPSIRDVEKELGLSRNIVRRAYLELEEYGILKLKHGKGVIVHNDLSYPSDLSLAKRSQRLCQETLAKASAAGIVASSLARMLYQMALEQERLHQRFYYVDTTEPLAQDRAAQISQAWQISIIGLATHQVPSLEAVAADVNLKLFTSYYRYGEVSAQAARLNAEVIPVALKFNEAMIEEIQHIPDGSVVEIVLDEHDFASYGGLILNNYQRGFAHKDVLFKVIAFTSINDLKKRLKSGECHTMIISNKLWDDMPADFKRLKGVRRPKMDFDARASEQARWRAGIVI